MSNVKEMKVEMDFADRLAEKIYGEPRLDQMDCAKLIREALASRPVREEVGEELKLLRDTMVKICKLHGIEDPIQLIGAAQNNEETYADIAVREIEKHLAILSHPDTAERLRERLEFAKYLIKMWEAWVQEDEREARLHFSSPITSLVGEPEIIKKARAALLPPSKTESKGETT